MAAKDQQSLRRLLPRPTVLLFPSRRPQVSLNYQKRRWLLKLRARMYQCRVKICRRIKLCWHQRTGMSSQSNPSHPNGQVDPRPIPSLHPQSAHGQLQTTLSPSQPPPQLLRPLGQASPPPQLQRHRHRHISKSSRHQRNGCNSFLWVLQHFMDSPPTRLTSRSCALHGTYTVDGSVREVSCGLRRSWMLLRVDGER